MASLIAYAFLSALLLGGALGVVAFRNVVDAALALLVAMGAVAGLFILLLAEFLALVQILIYGGAVTIVLLFALMLTRLEEFSRVQDNPQRPLALLIALALLGLLAAVFLRSRLPSQPLQPTGIGLLGKELFVQWAVPFEVASLLLLLALVGAILIARPGRGE